MAEYPKIQSVFRRHTEGPNKGKFIVGDWSRPEFELLKSVPWVWTEKLNGTNMRVHSTWGGGYEIKGRTDRAQLHPGVVDYIKKYVSQEAIAEIFSSVHKGCGEVILYGEGIGAGIQKGGGNYGQEQSFVLFDVKVYSPAHGWICLEQPNIEEIAKNLGISHAPVIGEWSIWGACSVVHSGLSSQWGRFDAEGAVGRPKHGLLNRLGRRIITKIKTGDFIDG